MQISPIPLSNNMQLEDITQAAIINNLLSSPDHLRIQLNNITRTNQMIQLEEKIVAFGNHFQTTSDSIRAQILKKMDDGIHQLEQEERNLTFIQDPPQLRGRRTYRQGGRRLQTGGERADKELQHQDQMAGKEIRDEIIVAQYIPPNQSNIPSIDLTSSNRIPANQNQSNIMSQSTQLKRSIFYEDETIQSQKKRNRKE